MSALVRLSTERVTQEALEHEQAEVLGQSRYERQPTLQGYRHGSEDGTVKTAEGVFRSQLPQVRVPETLSVAIVGCARTDE